MGLDAILSEGYEGEDWAVKTEAAGGKERKRFAEQHLEDPTYLLTHKKLKEHRNIMETLRGKLEQRGYPRRRARASNSHLDHMVEFDLISRPLSHAL